MIFFRRIYKFIMDSHYQMNVFEQFFQKNTIKKCKSHYFDCHIKSEKKIYICQINKMVTHEGIAQPICYNY